MLLFITKARKNIIIVQLLLKCENNSLKSIDQCNNISSFLI